MENRNKKNKLNRILLIIIFFTISLRVVIAKQPEVVKVNTIEKLRSYVDDNDIKFTLEDYVGEWWDYKARTFIFNKDLTFEAKGARSGSCKLLEQTNVSIILKCNVKSFDNSGESYLALRLKYETTSIENKKGYIYIYGDLNQKIECVRGEIENYREKCLDKNKYSIFRTDIYGYRDPDIW